MKMSENELICPYCGETQLCHEPDVIDADCANTECEFCERTFEYSVTVKRYYTSTKLLENMDEDVEDNDSNNYPDTFF